MRWNGRGELVCPAFAGQSLESRLAAQRSVVRAIGVGELEGMSRIALIGALIGIFSATSAQALELSIWVSNGWSAGWLLKISSDRTADLTEASAERQGSKRFQVSRKALLEVRAVLEREDFFSLPAQLGSFPPDAAHAEIEVRDGSRKHKVTLGLMPQDLAVIWKTDPSTNGRGYRICEALRLAFPGIKAQPCPGVPSGTAQ